MGSRRRCRRPGDDRRLLPGLVRRGRPADGAGAAPRSRQAWLAPRCEWWARSRSRHVPDDGRQRHRRPGPPNGGGGPSLPRGARGDLGRHRDGGGPRRPVRRLRPPRPHGRRLADPQRAVVPGQGWLMNAVAASPAGREQSRARYPDRTGFVVRDGIRTFYEVYGSGDPPILFVPTWSIVHSRIWKGQIPWFARRHKVVTFDAIGNGRSDRPTDPAAYAERRLGEDIGLV